MNTFTHSELATQGAPSTIPEWMPEPAVLPVRFTEISVPLLQPLQLAEKLMDVIAPDYVVLDVAVAE